MCITDIADKDYIKLLKRYALQNKITKKNTLDNFVAAYNKLDAIYKLEKVARMKHIFIPYNVASMCGQCIFSASNNFVKTKELRTKMAGVTLCKDDHQCQEIIKDLSTLTENNEDELHYIWFSTSN